MMLLALGSPELFGCVREYLRQSGFSEDSVCHRLGLRPPLDFSVVKQCTRLVHGGDDPLDVVIRLFILEEVLSLAELERHVTPAVREAMTALGLLSSEKVVPEQRYSSVALYPTQGLFIVSDRRTHPDRSLVESFDDVIYPAITKNTRDFLAILPDERCECFLDLCSGTGIAAFVGARIAKQAWATDITERSVRVAEFNRLLNAVPNVTVAKGDLYEAVGEQTFDRIVAHPPYVPGLQAAEIYRDGGEDGERVTRRIVQGLPTHLRPGGRFYCLSLGTDRGENTLEQRVRSWLEPDAAQFDVAVVARKYVDAAWFAMESAVKERAGIERVERWKAMFQSQNVTALVYASFVIQRKQTARQVFTVRREQGPQSGRAEIEWLLAWETAAMEYGCEQLLASSHPRVSKDLTLRVSHRIRQGEMVPANFMLLTDYPFCVECEVQPWVGFLLARSNGSATALQLFDYCKENVLIHPESTFSEFASLLRTLVAGGFLELEAFMPPEAKGLSVQAADCESHPGHERREFEPALPSPMPHPTG